MLYSNFVLLLLWSIADCKPTNRQQGIQFLDKKHDPELLKFVQDFMQRHDNNNPPTFSWEEVNAANSMPCSNAEIINGINYDYYLQYMDINENFARDDLENIEHVELTDPMLHGCRPVIYCAEVKLRPYVRHDIVNRNDDCFVLTENGKTPYSNYKKNKQHKPNITENTNNPQNKTTTLVDTNLPTPQPIIDERKWNQYEPPRHMYIAVHNNINMGGNDQIYNPINKENIKQQSTPVANNTTPVPINTTMVNETFATDTTTESPNKTTTKVDRPNCNENKTNSLENKHFQEHIMQENHKANIKLLLDFLTSFRKKLCKDAVDATNTTHPMTATTEAISNSTATPRIKPENKTLSDDVIFVIQQNVSNANETPNISTNGTVPENTKPTNETITDPDSVAVKVNKTNNPNEKVGPINVNNIPTANTTSQGQNSQKPTDMQVNGAYNYEYRTNKSYRDLLARIRNNYYITQNGYILKPEINKRRPYYIGEPIQPHYYDVHIPQPQRLNSPPRTYYWNNIVRRRYGKLSDNHQLRELPLEICDSESMSMNKSQLDSVDSDE